MEHEYAMQHHPTQSPGLPKPQRSSPRPRPSSRGRIYRGEESGGGGGGVVGGPDNHHRGHIMQSRTASHAHVITRSERSRSKGRRRRERRQQEQQGRQVQRPADGAANGGGGEGRSASSQYVSSFNDPANGRFSEEANNATSGSSSMQMHRKRCLSLGNEIVEGKINEYGRCLRHPNIELCAWDSATSEWRVLLQDCPLCSLDDSSGLAHLSSSQATPTPSTKTNQTLTTEEESSVKSWTVSDASTSGSESISGGRTVTSTAEHLFKPRPPPPRPKPASNYMPPPQDNPTNHRGGNRQAYQQNNNPTKSHPVQSLKVLGRKLVMESEQRASNTFPLDDDASAGMRSRFPPPPPPARNGHAAQNNDGQQRRGSRAARPPPRRQGETTAATGGMGAGARGSGEPNGGLLGEVSDVIARMEILTTDGESRGEAMSSLRSSRRQQQQQQNQQQNQQHQTTDTAAAVEAAEKRQKAQRRREQAERKAARLRAREARHQPRPGDREEPGGSGRTFTVPMNDAAPGRGGGRGGEAGTDGILQAAARVRARARKGASRSRERLEEASAFCGEAPGDGAGGGRGDARDRATPPPEKIRSIMNPHGLEGQPRPPAVERGSQSRERRMRQRSQSGGKNRDSFGRGKITQDGDTNINQGEVPVVGERGLGTHVQNRIVREDYSSTLNNQQTAAEGLLTRRREMRQKIAERQHNAQSRKEHRQASSRGGGGLGEQVADDHSSHLSLRKEVLEAWSGDASHAAASVSSQRNARDLRRAAERVERPERGRSRSAVRDGISRIRSSSLFRKKGGGTASRGETPGEDQGTTHTFDSGRRSASSFRQRLSSRGKPRSRSRGPGSPGRGGQGPRRDDDGSPHDWAAKSETFPANERHNPRLGDFDSSISARSDINSKLSTSSRSSFGIFKRSKSKTKKTQGGGGMGMGMVRSLSRGSFRNNNNDVDNEQQQHGIDEGSDYYNTHSWEIGSMRSSSSGKPTRAHRSFRD